MNCYWRRGAGDCGSMLFQVIGRTEEIRSGFENEKIFAGHGWIVGNICGTLVGPRKYIRDIVGSSVKIFAGHR